MEADRVDMAVHEKDKIVMKGKGRAVLDEIGGTGRKERIRIRLNLYR